jgi:FlaA1/EpsC-like NDP-sugar epimerase
VVKSRFRRVFGRVYPWLAMRRRGVALTVYTIFAAFSFVAAYLLRFAAEVPEPHRRTMVVALALLLPLRVVGHQIFRVTTGRWRYASLGDLLRLVLSVTSGSVVFVAIAWGVIGFDPRVPLGVVLIEWVLTTYLIAGLWAVYRTSYEWIQHGFRRGQVRRVLIVGAGEAGDRLLRELQRAGREVYEPVGFIDDDRTRWGARLQGVEVLGELDDLSVVAQDTAAEEILVAVPSAGPEEMRRIVAACQATGLRYRVLPAIAAVLNGSVSLDQLRQVRIEDLLGREPIRLELPALAADIGGKTVLVTGAAGSIGSELSRQIALHGPRRLVLLDQAESPLYFVQRELSESYPELDLVAIVGDIRDPRDIERAVVECGPERVFHAAAYKHVPLMEDNTRAGFETNVLGTRAVIEACERAGVEKFVLISTDKAVRPSSVMGASKRAAELLLLEAAERSPHIGWYAVRFGNVLGSAGSVIPLFKRQLGTGKPLTVTHPEVTRYFMTIPEAVQLILQATLLPEARGRIAMLDMGQPVRILDLARDLIRLSGRTEGVDAEIVITGLRPGEKLHEELTSPEETAVATEVDKISVLLHEDFDAPDAMEVLCPPSGTSWEECGDAEIRERLMRLAHACDGAAQPVETSSISAR